MSVRGITAPLCALAPLMPAGPAWAYDHLRVAQEIGSPSTSPVSGGPLIIGNGLAPITDRLEPQGWCWLHACGRLPIGRAPDGHDFRRSGRFIAASGSRLRFSTPARRLPLELVGRGIRVCSRKPLPGDERAIPGG
jgi:hypothetical protein